MTITANGTLGATNNGLIITNSALLNFNGVTNSVGVVTLNNGTMINGKLNMRSLVATGTNVINSSIGNNGTGNFTNVSGMTTLSGSNSYSGNSRLLAGTVVAANNYAFGDSRVRLDGAELYIQTNTAINTLDWNTNASVMTVNGNNYATVTNYSDSGATNTIVLTNAVLDNNWHTRLAVRNASGFSVTDFTIDEEELRVIEDNGWTYLQSQIAAGNDYIITNNQMIESNGIFTVENLAYAPNSTLLIQQGGQLIVSSNYTSATTGTLNYQFGTTGSAPGITVSNTMTLGGNFIGNFVQGAPSYGSKYKVATAGTITSHFGHIEIDTNGVVNPLLRGREIIDGDPVLSILIAPTSYTQMAMNQNQVNVAAALNSFIPATSGDNKVVSTALDYLTAAEYPNAFQQISPALYSTFGTIAFNSANAQNVELVQRLGNLRIAGVGFDTIGLSQSPIQDDNKTSQGSGKDILIPSVDNHWGIFVDGNGIFANVNINNQLPGYTAESGGVTLGGSYKWNNTFTTGLYAGYQGMQSLQQGSSILDNSARFGLFGTYQRGGLFANAILGGDSHSYQVNRNINFPGIKRTATSAPTGGELDSMLATGYDVKRGNFIFGPTTSMQYTYLGVQPFGESGAQALNLNVEGENASSLIYSLGTHCFYTWQVKKDILVVPQITLSWQHEFLQNPYAINSTLQGGGGVFNYSTTAPLRDSLLTGIGCSVNFAKKYDVSFTYNATAGNSDLVSQNFFVSLGTKF